MNDGAVYLSTEKPDMVAFQVQGTPQGKGRARIGRNRVTGRPQAYTPAATVAFEEHIAIMAKIAMRGRPPMTGPVELEVVAHFIHPERWNKKRKRETLYHTSVPDADNVLKAVGDGCNKVCWKDDAQVARATISKVYSNAAKTLVIIRPARGAAVLTGAA